MHSRLIPLATLAVLLMAGCKETPSETATDVAKAREDAAQKVDDTRQEAAKDVAKANEQVAEAQADYQKTDDGARKKLTKAESEAMIKTAHADYDVAVAEAEGREKVAKEKCDALQGADKDSCISTAEANVAADKAAATAKRDATLADAEHHD